MYCPECGTQALTGAKFCHGCGRDLRGISLLPGPHGSPAPSNPSSPGPDSDTESQDASWGAVVLLVLFIVAIWYVFFGAQPE